MTFAANLPVFVLPFSKPSVRDRQVMTNEIAQRGRQSLSDKMDASKELETMIIEIPTNDGMRESVKDNISHMLCGNFGSAVLHDMWDAIRADHVDHGEVAAFFLGIYAASACGRDVQSVWCGLATEQRDAFRDLVTKEAKERAENWVWEQEVNAA